jgi:hypothetical protein
MFGISMTAQCINAAVKPALPVIAQNFDVESYPGEIATGARSATFTRLGQPDGISPSRMAEMLEVDKAGPNVRC